jgi:Ca2+-binding RTX toxin-like protein
MRRSIGSFVLAGVLFGTADAGAAPIAVTSAFGRPAVEHPRGVTLSDITGDGNADVVVANYTAAAASPGSISVFPGDGAGALRARRDYAVGDGPVSVVAADLNGDKRSDVAVADVPASKVFVLLNDPARDRLRAPAGYPVGGAPIDLLARDLNRDGKVDLATVNHDTNTLSVLHGNGNGTFEAAASYSTGSAVPVSLAAGDVTGDARLDIVVSHYDSDLITVLAGNPAGGLEAPAHFPVGDAPIGVVVADFNRDGRPDAAVANSRANTLSVLLGTAGSLGSATSYPVGPAPRSVAVGDLNRDGRLDLVVANSGSEGLNSITTLAGRANGTFSPRTNHVAGVSPFDVAVGRVNRDAKPDIALTNYYSNRSSVVLGCTRIGTQGNDVLRGTTGRDVMCGRGGSDSLAGRAGVDVLDGGAGADTMVGGVGGDRFFARDERRDRVYGGDGTDSAQIDPGVDVRNSIERLF